MGHSQDIGTLQRELELQLQRSVPQPEVQFQRPVEKKQPNLDEQKVVFKGFKFKGNALINDEQLQAVVKPWFNTAISFDDLKDLTTAIQNFYTLNHRIAQATIPPQDVEEGILSIEILEGRLGSVIVVPTQPGIKLRVNPEMVKPYLLGINSGQYIDTLQIDRGMVLFSELPGVNVTGEFLPGKNPRESDFQVKLSDGPLFSGQVGLSNYGSASTGTGQLVASLALNNPSGFGDQVSLDALQSLGSTLGQLTYSLPVGHDGWRVGVRGNYLTSQTLTTWSTTQVQGAASTIGLNATYAFYRRQGNAANLLFTVDNKNYQNTQLGEVISQYQIKNATAAINGFFYDTAQSVMNYSLGVTIGNLNIQDITQASSDLSGPGTAGNYQKLSFNISRTKKLDFLKDTTWILSASGQLANKNLNSAEQIYVGGPYAVRAYPVGQGGGSQGVILSTQLLHRFDEKLQFGVFGDLGIIQQFVNLYSDWQGLTNANNNYLVGTIGPSINYTFDHWTFDLMAAWRIGQNPLYNSSGQQLNNDNAYRSVQAWVKGTYAF